ncbi:hypothetical protein [Nonomuraea longicatena]|uniref:Uncharacterized protein n=1 Tax=Nonomuraea longicatena TaxID=83682 RepID=A0ABP3ZQT5_9ACTN
MNTRLAFLAAPVLVFAYGAIRILDGLDGSYGPGLAWTTGHLAFMAALVLYVPIFGELRRMAGRGAVATVSAALGVVGVAVLLVQFGIDIVVGFMSEDRAGMSTLFGQIQEVPGVSFAIYAVLPLLFYLGQLALIVQLGVTRRIKPWIPVVFLVHMALPFVAKDLIAVSAAVLLISFVALSRQVEAPPSRTPAVAST